MAIDGDLNILDADLEPHSDFIRSTFSSISTEFNAYRWVGNPVEDEHFVSVAKKSIDDALPVSQIPQESQDVVSGLSLSMFKTKEQAKEKFRNIVAVKAKRDKKNGTTLADVFTESVGTYVAEITLKPEDGYIGMENDKSGHFEFIPSQNFDWEQCVNHIESMI